MMKIAMLYACLATALPLHAAPIQIAILDTGVAEGTAVPLCRPPLNHTSIGPNDHIGHGEYVAQLVVQAALPHAACVESHKVIGWGGELEGFVEALQTIGPEVKWINISLEPSEKPVEGEYELFKRLLASGKGVVLAAGNKGLKRLTRPCTWYPHCYAFPTHLETKWLIAGAKEPRRNYATGELITRRADAWFSLGPDFDIKYGTSFAAPRVVGELIKERR